MADKKPKLTQKQAKFVKGIAEGKTQAQAYIEAYDTKGHLPTVEAEASKTTNLPQVKEALQQLFSMEKTQQVVSNLHRLAISAEDEKVQVESTKVWLDRAVPKTDSGNTINNFGQILVDQRAKYLDE